MNKEKNKYPESGDKIGQDYKNLEKAYREIKDSYTELIFSLALLAENRDTSTGNHLVRIADYSVQIARSLGLSEHDVELIKYASPMHDIGKLVIPDAILKKPDKLTKEERMIMRKHTKAGAKIFDGDKTPLLKAAKIICLSHHERFDGTGYPKGLKGEEIPLFARIVSVADVFDALTFNRPYKSACEFDEAMKRIEEESGKHFDPKIVKAFLKGRDKIYKIWKATKTIESFISENA